MELRKEGGGRIMQDLPGRGNELGLYSERDRKPKTALDRVTGSDLHLEKVTQASQEKQGPARR